MAAKKKELSPKELRFCHEYCVDHNATQAAIRAGYSRRSSGQLGHRLIQKDEIWAKIQQLEDAGYRRVQASADRVKAEWANLGFSDPSALVWKEGELDSQGRATPEGTVKSIHEMPPEVRRSIKSFKFDLAGRPEFTFWDKHTALTNIAKTHKILSDKVDVTHSMKLEDLVGGANAEESES